MDTAECLGDLASCSNIRLCDGDKVWLVHSSALGCCHSLVVHSVKLGDVANDSGLPFFVSALVS
jgi:hypothetical protein